MPIVAKDFVPRHCQELMRDFMLSHNRCNLWAAVGTGKTGAVYVLFLLLQLLGSEFVPVLVIAPKNVAVDVWSRERAKWLQFLGFRVIVLAGREDAFDRVEQLRRPHDFCIINYELLASVERRLKSGKISKTWGLIDYFDEKKIKWPYRSVVADESTRLRGFRLRNGTKTAAALARISKWVGRWINLTGTPRPKDLIDLWGQMWFIDRGERLGRTFGEFQKKYFDEDVYAHKFTPKPGAAAAIAALIRDVTITIKAEDYFDLPPIIVNKRVVQLSDAAMEKYRQMESAYYIETGGKGIEAPNGAVASMKCLQMASGAVYTDDKGSYAEFDDAKLDDLESLMAEAEGPVLVGYHWKFDVPRLKKRFPHAVEIKGTKQIDDWNAGKIDMALIHPGSFGEGIDLAVGGNVLVFYSQWWDLRMYLQLIGRLGPMRQVQHNLNRPVWLHLIIAENTLDEIVVARRETRRIEQDETMDAMKR